MNIMLLSSAILFSYLRENKDIASYYAGASLLLHWLKTCLASGHCQRVLLILRRAVVNNMLTADILRHYRHGYTFHHISLPHSRSPSLITRRPLILYISRHTLAISHCFHIQGHQIFKVRQLRYFLVIDTASSLLLICSLLIAYRFAHILSHITRFSYRCHMINRSFPPLIYYHIILVTLSIAHHMVIVPAESRKIAHYADGLLMILHIACQASQQGSSWRRLCIIDRNSHTSLYSRLQ